MLQTQDECVQEANGRDCKLLAQTKIEKIKLLPGGPASASTKEDDSG